MARRVDEFGLILRLFGRTVAGDERGTVAVIFSVCAFVIAGAVGGAIDYGRWNSANYQMQLVLDSATLEAGRALRTHTDVGRAAQAGEQYFATASSQVAFVEKVAPVFTTADDGTAVVGRFDNAISAPFLSILGIGHMKVSIASKISVGKPAAGGSDDGKRESDKARAAEQKAAFARKICPQVRQYDAMIRQLGLQLPRDQVRLLSDVLQNCNASSDTSVGDTTSSNAGEAPSLGGLRIVQ
jgi:hypothetical protein